MDSDPFFDQFASKMKSLAEECAVSAQSSRDRFRWIAVTGFIAAGTFIASGLYIAWFFSLEGILPAIGGIIIFSISVTTWRRGDRARQEFLELREQLLDDLKSYERLWFER